MRGFFLGPGWRPAAQFHRYCRTMSIRSATPLDAAAMLGIYAPYVTDTAISFETDAPSADEFSARIERNLHTAPSLVFDKHDEILGYAYATEFRARTAYDATRETTVYVSPHHHGTGVGTALMTELIDRLRSAGIAVAVAGITLPNDPSVALHERVGFQHVGTFHRVGRKFGEWHDVGFWELQLDTNGDE